MRVLLVDDNPHVLSALVDLFGEEPTVRVVGAALRADDAITLAVSRSPDAVLVDAHMPDGGGQRVVRSVRALLPGVRLVALSAYLDPHSVSRMLSLGADVYFSKSADLTSLIRSLTHA